MAERNGNWTCPTCGKVTYAVLHSCPLSNLTPGLGRELAARSELGSQMQHVEALLERWTTEVGPNPRWLNELRDAVLGDSAHRDTPHHVTVADGMHTCTSCGITGDTPPTVPCLGPAGRTGDVWWVINGADLLRALRRVGRGDLPDIAYAELVANSTGSEQ